MSVELEPPELSFQRPFTHEVSQILRLRNTASDAVAFKVKTTAPKQYCVRPNAGRIEPGREVEVQVLLQAMKEDPPLDVRCKDKFLVQSVPVPTGSDATAAQVWAHVDANARNTIQEKKIRVTFLPASGLTSAGVNNPPPAYDESHLASTPTKNADSRSIEHSQIYGDTTETSTPQAAISAVATTVSNALPSQDDIKRQLELARAQIVQLQQKATEGLRERKTATGGEKATTSGSSLQTAPAPGGVSVQITALLCLLSFLIAYLFF